MKLNIYLLLLGLLVQNIICNIYYCENTKQTINFDRQNVTQIVNIITRYSNDTTYRPNQICEWLIKAPNDYRIELFNILIDVQYSHIGAICSSFDYLHIAQKHESLSVCRDYGGLNSIYSINNSLDLKFQSNYIQQYKGISFSMKIWNSANSCPDGWYLTKNSQNCFGIYDINKGNALDVSQLKCNLAQSNLASFESNEELEEVINNYLEQFKAKQHIFWIGLNDIEKNNNLKWLDNSSLAFKANIISKNLGTENFCFSIELPRDGSYLYSFNRLPCNEETLKLRALCKMPRQGFVPKYVIPELDIKKREDQSSLLIFLKIGVPIIASIVLITTILGIIIYKCRQRSTAEHIPVNEYELPSYNDAIKE